MSYIVKECYYTLQGEGGQSGRAAVFCRFAGCNLWSGLEKDRETAACTFCDTDFVGTNGRGGGKFDNAIALANHITSSWVGRGARPLVVFTGGEPLLQVDESLLAALHLRGWEVAVESNGTITAPAGIDWLTVSPKGTSPLLQKTGTELKLVFPQDTAPPENFKDLPFKHFFLQPMDGPDRERNCQLAVHYCLAHPQWRLSVQVHKIVGIS
ncbi:MAG: 7-carboxy-7-deazaguanine synthase [Myxococcales bacterium]|nr:7-carboxy-7-deazaguanine synthase [Myxococcales bacterium]